MKKLPKTPKTPMDYIRDREACIELEIILTGLWNDEDVSNTDVRGSGRDSTSSNVRCSVKSPKSPKIPNSPQPRNKAKVKETEPPNIALTALWSKETKVDRNPVSTGDPGIDSLDYIHD